MSQYRTQTLLLLLFSIPTLLLSQTSLKAKKLLDDTSVQMRNYNNYQFKFKYSLENSSENIKQETNGSVVVSQEKYKLITLDITQLFDGKNLYTIFPENEEVLITSSDQEENILLNPTELIDIYKTGYDFQWDIIQNVEADRPMGRITDRDQAECE